MCCYSKYFARKWSVFPRPSWSKHTICIESFRSNDYPNTRAFSNDHHLSWRGIQICDPPIPVARLHTYSGVELWNIEPLRLTEIFTTKTAPLRAQSKRIKDAACPSIAAMCMSQQLPRVALSCLDRVILESTIDSCLRYLTLATTSLV
jgi:hypothetical protein